MSLEQQNAEEADYLQEPGFTANEIRPQGAFSGLTPEVPVKGALSGALETGSVLAQGIGAFLSRLPAKGTINPVGIGLSEEAVKPWEKKVDEVSDEVSTGARNASKSLMPDPRTTGAAGNLVFGASKVLTEAGLMTAATGSPVAGAVGLGAVQGVSRYKDLREEGVDENTARKAALVEGGASTLGMLAPVGLPAAWISDLAPAARLMTQLATGAASNVGQGVAQRYVTHKILADAGWTDLADHNQALDGEAILSDALAGAGFGGMHFLHQRPEFAEQARALAANDGALRDAARVVQDSHEIMERAPGVPVDAESGAIHREAMEKALGDLLRDEPVDVSRETTRELPPVPEGHVRLFTGESGAPNDQLRWFTPDENTARFYEKQHQKGASYVDLPVTEAEKYNQSPHAFPGVYALPPELANKRTSLGSLIDATFARQAEHTLDARQMLRDEFERAGVFDEGTKLDEMMRAMEQRYEPTITPRERGALTMPDEEGRVRNADDILAETKEQREKAKEDEPLFKLAADCAGRVA